MNVKDPVQKSALMTEIPAYKSLSLDLYQEINSCSAELIDGVEVNTLVNVYIHDVDTEAELVSLNLQMIQLSTDPAPVARLVIDVRKVSRQNGQPVPRGYDLPAVFALPDLLIASPSAELVICGLEPTLTGSPKRMKQVRVVLK